MPVRFFGPIAEIIMAAALTMFIAAGEVVNGVTLSTPIWDKTDMRLVCLAGSTGGAFVYIFISYFWPETGSKTPQEHGMRLVAKFLSSWICGMIFSPLVFRWLHIPADADMVLGISGCTALGATSIIHRAIPQVTSWALSRLPKAPAPEVKPEDEEATNHHA